LPTPYDDFTPGSDILLARQEQAYNKLKKKLLSKSLMKSEAILSVCVVVNTIIPKKSIIPMDLVKTKFPGISYSLSDSIVKELIDELQGFGPIAELIEAPDVSDVVIVHSNNLLSKGWANIFI
jgi:hypothetical protein